MTEQAATSRVETTAVAEPTVAKTPAAQSVAPPAKEPAILTRQLTKRYGALTALDSLDLQLESGDVFGFIGPNGAGKSTTMKILAGLLSPTSGMAEIFGKNVFENGDFVRRSIGYMPDSFGVYEDLKVTEYLEFFAAAYDISRKERKRVVNDVLELTDLQYKRGALVDSLSRGMQQRLGLARVLVHDPPILILDEPASGLDPRARIEIRELLKELQRMGKTIMISSHILSELGEFCNKIGIIERGRLLVVGAIDELVARARLQSVVHLQVVSDQTRAAGLLIKDPRIAKVEEAGNQLILSLKDANQHHSFVIDLLVAQGISIHSITPEQIRLEDVFLRLTKGIVH